MRLMTDLVTLCSYGNDVLRDSRSDIFVIIVNFIQDNEGLCLRETGLPVSSPGHNMREDQDRPLLLPMSLSIIAYKGANGAGHLHLTLSRETRLEISDRVKKGTVYPSPPESPEDELLESQANTMGLTKESRKHSKSHVLSRIPSVQSSCITTVPDSDHSLQLICQAHYRSSLLEHSLR
ncbi:hypothetical protein AC579_5145 [Pseudocercospora musae]|uniref:Uncharacterized protein n=1 Tax=Pseudocercospora musae TaxID=113226 RepID=A0A139INU3_9PEZI|nr:hypothetical protein AC579_5145 [Pseudocercospora musae]